ncbi:Uncharacterized [Syntrophomonas zehnderi OL-4]|uniref:Uncharacterized n=1 Tax=Syntrophomonas zehnderi OL-4 TaxID=690567 RepID=A0A0E4GEE3_9FIRM|nr:hypothetical protein [Syntrophomonas zehnderi]CFX85564.1 Uncharacterized [Syntrophomonas zehnderi OL-4]
MENTVRTGVPKWIWVVIIALLASMYSYAAFFDPTRPDKIVEDFYQAYFTKDYDTVAHDLSVFWSVRFLPQYAEMSPEELVNNRAKVEKDISQVIAAIEKDNPSPQNFEIEIKKPYTKVGNYSAVVFYEFKEKNVSQGMEAALLIKEKGQFRIFIMSPVDAKSLDQVNASIDIKELDANFKELLETKA